MFFKNPNKKGELSMIKTVKEFTAGNTKYKIYIITEDITNTATEATRKDLINRIKNSFAGLFMELDSLKRGFKKLRLGKIQKIFNKIINNLEERKDVYIHNKLFWDLMTLREKIGEYSCGVDLASGFGKILNALLEIVVVIDKESTCSFSLDKLEVAISILDPSSTNSALKTAMFELVGWNNTSKLRGINIRL